MSIRWGLLSFSQWQLPGFGSLFGLSQKMQLCIGRNDASIR
jgi:hypothetical protein